MKFICEHRFSLLDLFLIGLANGLTRNTIQFVGLMIVFALVSSAIEHITGVSK